MAYVIAVSFEKGGTGKSTTALNVAAAFAELGQRTLLIDLDPSQSLSRMLGATDETFETTLLDVLHPEKGLQPIHVAIQQLKNYPNLDFVPAHTLLTELEILMGEPEWEHRLRLALEPVQDAYKSIILDCPPGLGFFPTNAFIAADLILIPVQTEFIPFTSLHKMGSYLLTFPEEYRPESFHLIGTMYDKRTRQAREVVEELQKTYPVAFSKHLIPRTVGFSESNASGEPFIHFNSDHAGARAYRGVAEEIISIWENRNAPQ